MAIKKYLIAAALGVYVPVAGATTVFTLGSTIGTDPVAATAEFSWNGNVLDLRLTNDTASISKTIQELTGIHFVLSGSPQLLSVSGSAEGGSVDCIGVAAGQSCPAYDSGPVDLFGSPPNLDGHGAAPSGWAALPSYALFTFGAGGGSWKPYGIVNDHVVGTGTNGNTSNPSHNPLLIGPVDFQFVFAPFDLAPTITGVDFYWGTGGDHRSGTLIQLECTAAQCDPPTVPEPQTLALLGLALFGMAAMRRRQRA